VVGGLLDEVGGLLGEVGGLLGEALRLRVCLCVALLLGLLIILNSG